jgi:ABC-2 type transport system permease protein
MIGRIWMVATRDFVATVSSRAFLIGLLMMPVMLVLMMLIAPRIMNGRSPQIRGEIEVIDHSGSAITDLKSALDPQAIAARRGEILLQSMQGGAPPGIMGDPPVLSVIERPASSDINQEKSWLIEPPGAPAHHLALVVIPANAVTLEGEADYGAYELYVSKGLNDATESVLHNALREALVSARMKVKSLDRVDIEKTLRVKRVDAVMVLPEGQRSADRGVRRFLPVICVVLLFITVFTGSQALMTSMIEEKSSRVVEVLLAAVSPLELMWGKLLAQLSVGLLILGVYVGLGLVALARLAVSASIEPTLLIDLAVLFIVSYLTYGAMMLTIGSAVNQMADAQSLLTPVILLVVMSYVTSIFVGQAPNSPLAVTLSFVPPLNTFVMLARLASDTPPPGWQVAATVGVGLVFACIVLWFAAKVFKIGLLMHGKPPTFGTLIRWARMA